MVFPSWHLFPKIALEKLFDVQKLPENGKTQSHLKSEFQEAIHVNPEQGRSVKFPCSLLTEAGFRVGASPVHLCNYIMFIHINNHLLFSECAH